MHQFIFCLTALCQTNHICRNMIGSMHCTLMQPCCSFEHQTLWPMRTRDQWFVTFWKPPSLRTLVYMTYMSFAFPLTVTIFSCIVIGFSLTVKYIPSLILWMLPLPSFNLELLPVSQQYQPSWVIYLQFKHALEPSFMFSATLNIYNIWYDI